MRRKTWRLLAKRWLLCGVFWQVTLEMQIMQRPTQRPPLQRAQLRKLAAMCSHHSHISCQGAEAKLSNRWTRRRGPGRRTSSRAGTWNDWKPAAMTWDGASFAHTVTLGEQGWESFQILAEGKWGATLYPSCADASPHVAHELLGPDGLGHAKNWTIGLHPADDAGPGMCFRVALRFDERGRPRGVSWRAVLPERVALEISADDLLAEAGLLLRSGRGPPARAARLAQEAAEVLEVPPLQIPHTYNPFVKPPHKDYLCKGQGYLFYCSSREEELGLRRRAGSAWGAAARGHLAQTAALPREGGAACAQRREHHAQAVAAAGRALARLAAPAEASEASEAEDYAGARSTLDSLLSMEIEHFVSSGAQDACAGMLQSAAAVLLDCGAFDCAAEVAKAAAMHYERIENTAQAGIAWDTKARAHVDLLWSEQGDDIGLSSRQCRSEHARAGREAAARAAELLASAGDRASRESLRRPISARCTSARAHALDLCKGFGELWLALLRESRAPCAEGLQQTFAYALGLGRPPQYAKFDVRDAVCQAAGGFSHGEVVQDREGHEYVVVGVHEGGDGEGDPPRLWFQPRSLQRAATCSFRGLGRRALRHVLRSVGTEPAVPEGTLEQFDLAEDSDGELVALCHECLLPLGAGAYPNPDGTGSLHGECLGQVLLERAEADDADRRREVAQCKARDRHEYRIGWRPEQVVPRAEDFFQARGVRPPRGASGGGSYGLALEGGSPPRVRLIGTEDPDCAINLEYLAIALQVRMKAGVAPYFSLDTPNTEEPWQVKTFDPPWLSGTCVGEVLFQADYHLKELSIGDFEQPVMGMRSVWDFEWKGDSWRGREWFVVRSAKVFLSDDNVLMPHVEMGVEARQQVADEMHQLVDAPLTTADHPLVKYAEMFTHYFDLIAERKSVVYQLREVSRASILAKFLVDSGVCLEEFWLQAPREQAANRLELPLTKSERLSYNVLVCDGVLQEVQNGVFKSGVQLSGGVDLNIDAFDLSAPVRVHKSVGGGDASEQAPGAAAAADAAEDLARLSQRELRSRIRQAGGAAPPGPADRAELLRQLSALRSAAGADEAPPAGEAEASTAEAPATEAPGAEACAAEHAEELALLEGAVRRAVLAAARRARARASGRAGGGDAAPWERAGLDPAAASLLREVFGSRLCDRRPGQGPPAGDGSRLESLRRLVGEERDARARRRQHFLGEDFSAEAPGPLFPASWRSAFSISFGRGAGPGGRPARRPLEHDGAGAAQALGAAAPVFDRSTEDGVRFRIYRRGSVEVRTTQPEGGDEAVGAVFELCAPPPPPASTPVVKVSEFVRSAESSPAPERPAYHHFLVVETDLGDAILAESREDGSVAWVPNSPGLGELCSRSRVLRAADCAGAGATAGQVHASARRCPQTPSLLPGGTQHSPSSGCWRWIPLGSPWHSGADVVDAACHAHSICPRRPNTAGPSSS
ncbi:unnamed protein product [Prorocentrum cordatum]|uniref:Uncharacterized protein n=1 Tax=Prorocentrum cordatum TaxID=2364126 RepID=A0ABN9Y5M1_9DINO|nr:unnamed protein product [Polarella glacialis]